MRVLITGAAGMLGRAITRLSNQHTDSLELIALTRRDCDLEDAGATRVALACSGADAIVHCAAVVGGIQANINAPERFLAANLRINQNVISGALEAGIGRFLFIGSSCMYPRNYQNPLKEDYLLAAPLEPTNEGYALAKIVGAKHCEYIARQYGLTFRTIIPCNLFGPNDNFDPVSSHLVASIIRKIAEAKALRSEYVEIWGDGSQRREFMYIDDLADFVLKALPRLVAVPQLLNIGPGTDHSVSDYYTAVAKIAGYSGAFRYDKTKPAGMQRKLLDVTQLTDFGWSAGTELTDGLARTYQWFLENRSL